MNHALNRALNRKLYLIGNLLFLLVVALLIWVLGLAFKVVPVGFAGLYYGLIVVLPMILMAKRLQDTKFSAWLSLLWVIPIVDIVLWLALFFIPTAHSRD